VQNYILFFEQTNIYENFNTVLFSIQLIFKRLKFNIYQITTKTYEL